jgi:hypothetical protein
MFFIREEQEEVGRGVERDRVKGNGKHGDITVICFTQKACYNRNFYINTV